MSFDEFVRGFIQSKLQGLKEPRNKTLLDILTRICKQPDDFKKLNLTDPQKEIVASWVAALRGALKCTEKDYPNTPQGILKFFHVCNNFLAAEFTKFQQQQQQQRLEILNGSQQPSPATASRPRSRSVTIADEPIVSNRSRSASRSQSRSHSPRQPRSQSRSHSPRPRSQSPPHQPQTDVIVPQVQQQPSPSTFGAIVEYTQGWGLPAPAYDSDDDSLSDCDECVTETRYVCRFVYQKDHGRKQAGDTCGREYHSPDFLCPNCGCCSGLHMMSGCRMMKTNPLHCNCMPKIYCGGNGGRLRSGLPCPHRTGGGRCTRHRHRHRVMKIRKKPVRAARV